MVAPKALLIFFLISFRLPVSWLAHTPQPRHSIKFALLAGIALQDLFFKTQIRPQLLQKTFLDTPILDLLSMLGVPTETLLSMSAVSPTCPGVKS